MATIGETLTVRLFVSTQTYDIPSDPRQPAKWLLQQAKNIQRSNQSSHARAKNEIQDELAVLFNRSRRQVIDLEEPIGRTISAMEVIEARTLLQAPDTTASALFPFLRTYPVTDGNLNLVNGLFFQQLYAYTLIGRKTPQLASQRREQQKKEEFLELLQAYMMSSFDEDSRYEYAPSKPHATAHYNNGVKQPQPQPTYYNRPLTPPAAPTVSALHGTPARRATEFPVKSFFATTPTGVRRQIDYPADQDSDSGSDSGEDSMTPRPNVDIPTARVRGPSPSPAPPAAAMPVRRGTDGNPLDEMEKVFDIVFKQQSIGMKLSSDEYRQYAVVKECFEGSEAKKHPDIQSGVVILAVNGQEVAGLGLSRVLYRLREAPRPVVVRFGRFANRGHSNDQHHQRIGTWG